WVAGVSAFRRCLGPSPAPPAVMSASGLCVLRDGLRGASLWAGSNGQHGLGGHAHNDKLACEVVLAGRRIVIDPGSPTYLADPAERDHYRSTVAHPTIRVDHQEQSETPAGRPFLLPETARARLLEARPRRARAE